MMETLQVSLLNSQDASSQNNNNDILQDSNKRSPTSTLNNSQSSYSSVRSMKDLLNPSSSNTTDYSNVISFQKEYSQTIHEQKPQTSTTRLENDHTSPKDNFSHTTSSITLPSLSNDIHKPPSSNSETSLRLPSIDNSALESQPNGVHSTNTLPSVITDIHNAGSMNVSQLINVASPQYYQVMMPGPYQIPPPGGSLPSLGTMVVPPSTNGVSPPSPTSSTSSLPAMKELLPNPASMIQQGYPGPYPVPWYGYPPSNYMAPATGRQGVQTIQGVQGVQPMQAVPYYGHVQEAIPVMVEATVEEDSRKRKAPSPVIAKKGVTSSPPLGSQSSNCQHHPKPDSDPKTVPFQLKFKSKKERPKNGAFEMQWMEHFTTLRQFYQQFGHTNVTRSTPGYKNLGNWVAEQRRKMRRGKLTKEQYELMNSIAFEWDRSYFFKPSVFTNSDEEREAAASEEKKFRSSDE